MGNVEVTVHIYVQFMQQKEAYLNEKNWLVKSLAKQTFKFYLPSYPPRVQHTHRTVGVLINIIN